MKLRFNGPSALAGLAVGVLLAGGVVWASGSIDSSGEQVCRTKAGYLRISTTGECRRSEVPVELPQGPQGEQGIQGEQGDSGIQGPPGLRGATGSVDDRALQALKCSSRMRPGADFSGCEIAGEDFGGLNMSGVSFRDARLTNVRFSGADLTGADFTGAVTLGSDFSSANLTNVIGLKICADGAPCRLGDVGPAGGVVAVLNGTYGYQGYEVNSVSLSTTALHRWGCDGTVDGANGYTDRGHIAEVVRLNSVVDDWMSETCPDADSVIKYATEFTLEGKAGWLVPDLEVAGRVAEYLVSLGARDFGIWALTPRSATTAAWIQIGRWGGGSSGSMNRSQAGETRLVRPLIRP